MNLPNKKTTTSMFFGCILGTALNSAGAICIDHDKVAMDPHASLQCSRTKQVCIDAPRQTQRPALERSFGLFQPEVLSTYSMGDNYEFVKYFAGRYAALQTIEIETAGTYEITLTDLTFAGSLNKFGATVTTASNELVEIFGTGSMLFDADPGTYYLSMFAKSMGQPILGLFGITIQPYSVSSVPVPAAAWLFGSGLIGLVGMARRKA